MGKGETSKKRKLKPKSTSVGILVLLRILLLRPGILVLGAGAAISLVYVAGFMQAIGVCRDREKRESRRKPIHFCAIRS